MSPAFCLQPTDRELGMRTVELVRILKIGQSAISRSVERAEKIVETENLVWRVIKALIRKLFVELKKWYLSITFY